MNKRPTSVTVIAWILVVMAGLSLIVSLVTLNDPKGKELMSRVPIPVNIQYAWMYAGILVQLICGIGMLKGLNWVRFLYVIWSIVGLITGIFISPFKAGVVLGIIVFIVVVFFLFRTPANDYFTGKGANSGSEIKGLTPPAEGPKGARKVISIIFYVISGDFFFTACFLAFMKKPWIFLKFALVGGFGIAALLILVVGLACVRFYNWKRNVGIVFVCAAVFTLFTVLPFEWVMRQPEIIKDLPADALDFFGDYVSGIICTAILGATGIVLIRISKATGKDSSTGDGDVNNASCLPGS